MNFKDKKVLVFDHGLFPFIAVRLAEDFGTTYYFKEWETGAPTPDDAFVGTGLPNITRVDSFFDVLMKEKPDLIVFPDVGHGDLQEYLREQGFKVFGTGKSEILEDDRVFLRKVLEKLKLPVSSYKVINGGIEELWKELEKEKNKYVKISLYRGVMETFFYENAKRSKSELDYLAYKLGILDKEMEFLIEDPIDSIVEVGAEWFFTDQGYLPAGMYGYEIKNKGYCGKIVSYGKLPGPLKVITDKFLPVYKKYKVRGALSIEARVTKDQKSYFIDPCMRFGSPPGEVLSEAYENMSEIMTSVADGKSVLPKQRYDYAAQVMLQVREPLKTQLALNIPEKYVKSLKFRNLCRIKGQYYHLPQDEETVIGAAIGFGKNIKEAQDKAMEAASQMEDHAVYFDKDVFLKADEQIKKGRRVGVEF